MKLLTTLVALLLANTMLFAQFPPVGQEPACLTDGNGNLVVLSPSWQTSSGIMYTSSHCVPNVKVGIGLKNPSATLTISARANTNPFLIQNQNGYKVMEVGYDGILYTREVKVNLNNNWPDYVFSPTYSLRSLGEVEEYIEKEGHLPNVPQACEMEENGVALGEMNRILIEKVEELTLYLIQQNKKLEEQGRLLELQRGQIEKLREIVEQ